MSIELIGLVGRVIKPFSSQSIVWICNFSLALKEWLTLTCHTVLCIFLLFLGLGFTLFPFFIKLRFKKRFLLLMVEFRTPFKEFRNPFYLRKKRTYHLINNTFYNILVPTIYGVGNTPPFHPSCTVGLYFCLMINKQNLNQMKLLYN